MEIEQLLVVGLAILAVGLLMKYVIRWDQPRFVQFGLALILAGGVLAGAALIWAKLIRDY